MKALLKTLFSAILIVAVGCGNPEATEKPETRVPAVDLQMAAATGNVDAIQQHIDAGSDLNPQEPGRGSTPLITATVFGQSGAALALIEGGADVNLQNNEGSSPLITAAVFCRTEIVQALLDKGADKTLRNLAGRTALESVSSPFDDVKEVYDGLAAALGPLGIEFDYEHIRATRPIIADMLR